MIHIIDSHLAAGNLPLLQSMFADRKRLFVDLFGWDVPVIDGKYEMDQFDNPNTIYLIVADEDGEHAASIRLFPSTRPHMLGTLFPHLCPLGVPADEATWESTRLCLPQRHGAERRRELRNMLISPDRVAVRITASSASLLAHRSRRRRFTRNAGTSA